MKLPPKIPAFFKEWSRALLASLLTLSLLLGAYFVVSAALGGGSAVPTDFRWSPGLPPQAGPTQGNVASVWVTDPALLAKQKDPLTAYHKGDVDINGSLRIKSSIANLSAPLVSIRELPNTKGVIVPHTNLGVELRANRGVASNPAPSVYIDFSEITDNVPMDYGARIVYRGVRPIDKIINYPDNLGTLGIAADTIFFTDNKTEKKYSDPGNTLVIDNNNSTVKISGNLQVKDEAGKIGGVGQITTDGNISAKGTVSSAGSQLTSDLRLKKDIHPIQNALARVLQLNGVNFYWKDKAQDSSLQMGVIAQEVEKVFPELVRTDQQTGLKSVAYANLVGALIEAVKEQQKTISSQGEIIQDLQKRVLDLEESA